MPKAQNIANALYDASSGEHLDIIQMLLEKGADDNAECGVYGNFWIATRALGSPFDIVAVMCCIWRGSKSVEGLRLAFRVYVSPPELSSLYISGKF